MFLRLCYQRYFGCRFILISKEKILYLDLKLFVREIVKKKMLVIKFVAYRFQINVTGALHYMYFSSKMFNAI